MTALDPTIIATLCRAARHVAIDGPRDVVLFVKGVLARGPVDPEALRELLELASIAPDQVAAAAELVPKSTTRTSVLRSSWLRRLRGAR